MSTPPTSPALADDTSADEKRKERYRVAERKSRLKRQANHQRMAAQVHALECVLANLMFLDNNDESDATSKGYNDLVLDDDESKRVRAFLRRMAPLDAEKVRLASEHQQLQQLVKDREAFDDLLRSHLDELHKENDWDWRVMRWRALTLASFEPWPVLKCDQLLEDSLATISGFMAKDDVVTTGLSFLGWRDRRRIDHATSTIEFSFYKTFPGNADMINDALWRLHLPGKEYGDVLIGRHVKVYSELLQEFDENRCLIRVAEQYPDSPYVIHMIMLLMRVHIDDACYIIRRAVPVPDVQASLTDADAVWASNYYWTSHLVLERNASGMSTKIFASTCGTIASTNAAYALRWLSEILFSVVRGESWVRGGTQLLLE